MNVRNCRKCKKLFNYVVGPIICPVCKDEMEAEFQKVKKYVQENPRCDIRTVSEECEVDPQQIRDWVREERLEFASDSGVGLNCEKCGKSISSGRFCPECKRDMTNSFNNAIGIGRGTAPAKEVKKPTKENPKMRFLDQ